MVSLPRVIQLIKNKGTRYLLFRSKYEIERKLGLLALRYPTKLKKMPIPTLPEWKEKGSGFFFESKKNLSVKKNESDDLKEKMAHILNGDVLFFNKTWRQLGLGYDWVTNPESSYQYDAKQHWTKVNDFSKEAGDIKFVWEKSRFSWLLTVCRYDYHFDEDHSEFVLGQIIDWIDKNPLNCGPNYKCSQETSIRLLNWLFVLNFYRDSESLTEERWQKIMTSIYWQIDHVYKNINFSRIAVRNNHAITETLTLYLMGLMFPMMKGADKWKKDGKKWFEEEINYQIEDDGTFIQDSMNYHRVVVQLLTYAIALADRHEEIFSNFVYEKAYKSVNFLYQCQEPRNGWLPNYGSNDGSLFFPLSDADYRDYRPQLDALHALLTGLPLYNDFYEDSQLVGAKVPDFRKVYPKLEKQYGIVKFEKSGYYLIREKDTLTFIRCGLFKSNGSNDQLHVDIWHNGKNVLMDCGSFKYNTDECTIRYFAGTESHNTVMIDDFDQMLKGPRFIWYYSPTLSKTTLREEYFEYVFEGEVIAYKYISEGGVTIHRTVKKKKGNAEWEICDKIKGAPIGSVKRQLWHTDSELTLTSNCVFHEEERWMSDYYGTKRCIRQIEFRSKEDIFETKIALQ